MRQRISTRLDTDIIFTTNEMGTRARCRLKWLSPDATGDFLMTSGSSTRGFSLSLSFQRKILPFPVQNQANLFLRLVCFLWLGCRLVANFIPFNQKLLKRSANDNKAIANTGRADDNSKVSQNHHNYNLARSFSLCLWPGRVYFHTGGLDDCFYGSYITAGEDPICVVQIPYKYTNTPTLETYSLLSAQNRAIAVFVIKLEVYCKQMARLRINLNLWDRNHSKAQDIKHTSHCKPASLQRLNIMAILTMNEMLRAEIDPSICPSTPDRPTFSFSYFRVKETVNMRNANCKSKLYNATRRDTSGKVAQMNEGISQPDKFA